MLHCDPAERKPREGAKAARAGLAFELSQEMAAELDRLAEEEAGGQLDENDLEGMELAYRAAARKIASKRMAKRLSRDRGYRGPRIDCGHGHQAKFGNDSTS